MDCKERLLERLWVLRYQAGDDNALESLVERYQGPLRYYLRRLVGDAHQADDVLQDVWMTVIRERGRLRDSKSFAVWLYRIARNQAFRFLRRQGRLPAIENEAALQAPQDDEPEFTAEEAIQVHACLDKLSLEHREVLTLRFFENMSYEQLAEVAGCSMGTVRSRLHYAKQALRKKIEETSHDKRKR